MDKSLIGLAGEYYVLAQLAQRNMIGTMTLSNTKGIDILVANQKISKLYKYRRPCFDSFRCLKIKSFLTEI